MRDPGFTPSLRELDALVDLLADDDAGKDAERAVARIGPAALSKLEARLAAAAPALRARVVRAIGRLAASPQAVRPLLVALDDADPKTRRNAAIALGHAPHAGVEDALLRAWERDARPEMRRSIAASLGKVGSPRALPLLRDAAAAVPDPELARIAGRALAMIERTASRPERGRIDAAGTAGAPVEVALRARRGLEGVLAEEAAGIAGLEGARVAGPGEVRARLAGPLAAVLASRTMSELRFPLAPEPIEPGESAAEAIGRAVTSAAARRILGAWTQGPVRYRIAWAGGGHRRAATWDAAAAIARRAPELVNDPTASTWEVVVVEGSARVEVALAPRALHDARFAWRRGDVPAASHPTIAAALARVAGVRADDVVWDPFVGSGSELVERALLGPYRELIGSDLDPRALKVAAGNLEAAGLRARLETSDALALSPPGVTLVITNPPMGRRAARTAALAGALDRFVAHVAGVLAPGGRLVWIAPHPGRSRAAARHAGLALTFSSTVDMGGFDAELQRWEAPAAPPSRRPPG